jgi:hypothetical protein
MKINFIRHIKPLHVTYYGWHGLPISSKFNLQTFRLPSCNSVEIYAIVLKYSQHHATVLKYLVYLLIKSSDLSGLNLTKHSCSLKIAVQVSQAFIQHFFCNEDSCLKIFTIILEKIKFTAIYGTAVIGYYCCGAWPSLVHKRQS